MKSRPADRPPSRVMDRWVSVLLVGGPLFFPIADTIRAEPVKEFPIELPPFVVHDSRFKVSLWNWGYMAFPGYEVLTGCSRGVTNEFVMGAARQLSILRRIAPAAFEAPASVPTSLILMNWNQAQAVTDARIKTAMIRCTICKPIWKAVMGCVAPKSSRRRL